MESIIELRKKTGVLVAAHRGTSGGNIPPNSIAAFDIALKEGADILEMDLFKVSMANCLYSTQEWNRAILTDISGLNGIQPVRSDR